MVHRMCTKYTKEIKHVIMNVDFQKNDVSSPQFKTHSRRLVETNLNVSDELRWLRTHRSVSLHFEETHDQKPPPRERRLQLRNCWSLMKEVECCEGLL